jgi:HlyD family secretion protein
MNKKKVFTIAGIAVVIFAVIYLAVIRPASVSAAGLTVKTETANKQDIMSTISATGVIEAINKEDVFLESTLKVKKLLIKKDDKVAKGQKLMEFDMDSMNSNYEQLKLQRDIQALNLKKVQETGSTQNIRSLELSLQQADANLKIDQRNLEKTKKDYESGKLLYESGAIAKNDYDTYLKVYNDATNRLQMTNISYESAKNNLQNAQKGNTIDLSSQEIQLRLKDIAISDMEQKIAQITACSISPMDGVVTVLNAVEGEFVNTMSPVYTISDNNNLQISADVKELDSKNIRTGQKVNVTGDGIDDGLNVTGTVTNVSSVAEVVNSLSGQETIVGITVTIDKAYPGLKPGLTVTCKVITDSRKNAVVAKYSMINNKDDGSNTVFLFTKDGTAKEVKVKTGITSDLSIEIAEGMNGGEEVIVNPPKTLKDGMKVKRDISEASNRSGFMRPAGAPAPGAGMGGF